MARTIQQIETDIDNNAIIKLKEYLKDYLVEQLNITVSDVDGELQKIFTAVNGLETIVQTIPKPQEPAATDPTTGNDGDLFFNTTDKWLKYYHNSTWHNLAQLSALVDLTPYAKTADVDTKLNNKADKTELDKYVKKSTIIEPTLDVSNPGYLMMSSEPFNSAPIGTVWDLDLLTAISSLANPLGSNDRLFAATTPVTQKSIPNLDGSENIVGLKFETKSNPTDFNIKDNYALKNFRVEKIKVDELRLLELVNKPVEYAHKDLSNVNVNNLWAKLTLNDAELITLQNDVITK